MTYRIDDLEVPAERPIRDGDRFPMGNRQDHVGSDADGGS